MKNNKLKLVIDSYKDFPQEGIVLEMYYQCRNPIFFQINK